MIAQPIPAGMVWAVNVESGNWQKVGGYVKRECEIEFKASQRQNRALWYDMQVKYREIGNNAIELITDSKLIDTLAGNRQKNTVLDSFQDGIFFVYFLQLIPSIFPL